MKNLIRRETLLGLINKKESSLAAKKAGRNKRNKSRVIFIQGQINNGGGEDRTRLSQIMSLVHSPDCYTPQGNLCNFNYIEFQYTI